MKRLERLENRSIFILREAYSSIRPLGMLWSIGKDSTVLLWLARKAFFGTVPFPLIHVDTSFKIPEMIRFRDRAAREWGLELLVSKNREALERKETFPDGSVDRLHCCKLLKSIPLQQIVAGEGLIERLNLKSGQFEPVENPRRFSGLILGIRADEEGTRAKERYFSLRGKDATWDVSSQPPELWNYFSSEIPLGAHLRVHPLLDWTELDVWEYIEREGIETVDLYFDKGLGERYRSLGCSACTAPIRSSARTAAEVVEELSTGPLSRVPERAGRAQDKEDGGGLEQLRIGGYM